MDKNSLKKYSVIVITIVIAILGVFFAYNKFYGKPHAQPNQTSIANLETVLKESAWAQLDQNGKEMNFEVHFLSTKENDPQHQSYDYQDYRDQRPAVSGYWKLKGNTITIISGPADSPSSIYRDVNSMENTLEMTDSRDNAKLKFEKLSSLKMKKQLITDAREVASKYNLISVSLFCVLSDIEAHEDISQTEATITFRERHGQSEREDCGGDPATSPRLFSLTIDRATGKVSTDKNSDGEMKGLDLDATENVALGMTLPVLKDKIIAYFKKFNAHTDVADSELEDFDSYYWVYVRRAPEDAELSFLKGLAPDEFDYARNRLGSCFGIPQGQCME